MDSIIKTGDPILTSPSLNKEPPPYNKRQLVKQAMLCGMTPAKAIAPLGNLIGFLFVMDNRMFMYTWSRLSGKLSDVTFLTWEEFVEQADHQAWLTLARALEQL